LRRRFCRACLACSAVVDKRTWLCISFMGTWGPRIIEIDDQVLAHFNNFVEFEVSAEPLGVVTITTNMTGTEETWRKSDDAEWWYGWLTPERVLQKRNVWTWSYVKILPIGCSHKSKNSLALVAERDTVQCNEVVVVRAFQWRNCRHSVSSERTQRNISFLIIMIRGTKNVEATYH